MQPWQLQALLYFYKEHLKISDIAKITDKPRETISRFITKTNGYEKEMQERKNGFKSRYNDYHRRYAAQARRLARYQAPPTGDSMRLEHETAVKILSAEKY